MTTTSDREDDEDEEEEGEDAVSDGDSPQFRHSSARSSISSQHGKTRVSNYFVTNSDLDEK